MNLLRALCLWLVLAGVLAASPASADVDLPQLHARVTDLTGTLDGSQAAALEQKLADFEAAKGSQIVVLILPTTQPETIEQFGIRLAEAWKVGRKGVDDGAILIIAKDDHRMRIEVGYGLEGALNDAICNRIISEVIAPDFKRGDYYDGIDAGLDRMIGVVNGEPLPPAPARPQFGGRGNPNLLPLFIAFIIFHLFGRLLRSSFGSLPASLGVGVGVGLVALVIFSSLVVALIVAAIAAVLALVLDSGVGGGWGGGWGGGSFGGGGASGSW